jgi:hypothetical protein
MPHTESHLSLEENIAALNKNIFLREFSFSKNKFKPNPNEELELADHIIWIDKLLIAYQLKERESSDVGSAENERNWFERKVLGKGTKQIRDTLKFLSEHPNISIENERGHVFNVNGTSVDHIIKVVVYAPGINFPVECRNIKCHISSTAGLIHVLPLEDYVGVCRNLITPAEIAEYFDYREEVLGKWSSEVNTLPEQAILGQFLWGDYSICPTKESVGYLAALEKDIDSFDITNLLYNFVEHTEKSLIRNIKDAAIEHAYYKILTEFAKLRRSALREIKLRVDLCLQACREDKFMIPTRMGLPHIGCGFVFIPLTQEAFPHRLRALENLTEAAKYDMKLDKQIGISFAKEGEDFLIDWFFIERPWQQDAMMEEKLRKNHPFSKAEEKRIPHYKFKP